jgi:hypothetical protein
MNSSFDFIDQLAIVNCKINVSFIKSEGKINLVISENLISCQLNFTNNFYFFSELIEKPFFKDIGLSYEKDNNIEFNAEVIFNKNDKKIQAIINNDNILILGKYSYSDIHDSINYIRLNNKLIPRNISLKPKKI